jgi:hypothetical protein
MMAVWGGISAAPAQNAGKPLLDRPVFTLPSFLVPRAGPVAKPTDQKSSEPPPIAFYVAAGTANACGPGCDAWIAAEGKIDLYAAQRLRKVLAKLGPRKLPLFLHSAGGSVLGAIELGRLVRSHNITVSIARTTPADCLRDEPGDKACEMLKRSGQELASDFDTSGAMCNSACVLVLAGGAQRSVPPWVRLGVHAIGIDLGKTAVRGPLLAAATRSANAHIVEFLHDMGIPKALFDVSNAVPHESTRFLQRDDMVRFGLDTREVGETDWRFADRSAVAIAKGFFVHTGDADLAYPEALLRLSCGAGKSMRLTFAREHPAAALVAGTRPVRLTMNGVPMELPYATQSGRIEVRSAILWPDAIAAADDRGTIEIAGFGAIRGARPPGGGMQDGKTRNFPDASRVVLSMAGFSAAYAKLRKVCGETASADNNGCSPGDLSPRCMPEALKAVHPSPVAAGGQRAWPSQ